MEFLISQEIFDRFPETKIGIVVAKIVDNNGSDERITELLEKSQRATKEKFNLDTLSESPEIAVWRHVYSSFGSKPREYRSSIESLVRSVLNGRGVRSINKLVDLYNHISLKYGIPVGGEDLDKVHGNLHLQFAEGHETFIPLGSSTEDNPYKGEVIYCDDSGHVLCRRWNWRESDITKLTDATTNAVIVAEGFDDTVGKVVGELSELIRTYCGGDVKTFIADKNTQRIKW